MKFFRSHRTQNDLYNHKFIVHIYRVLLGRDPDETGIRHYGAMLESGKLDPVGLINSILSSGEFASRMVGGESNCCLRSEAEDVFRRFEKYQGPGSPGYVTNFLGGLTDVRCAAGPHQPRASSGTALPEQLKSESSRRGCGPAVSGTPDRWRHHSPDQLQQRMGLMPRNNGDYI
jgi:hypothetical protein